MPLPSRREGLVFETKGFNISNSALMNDKGLTITFATFGQWSSGNIQPIF
jgi:hypothetical protein